MIETEITDRENAEREQDGAIRRNRSLVFATATSGLAKVISVVLNAITIPMVVRVLGADGYGLWTTIISISSFLVFADFGLSNGLVSVISEANGKRDGQAAMRAVSTTFFALLAFAAVFSALILVAAPWIPWVSLLNLTHSRLAPDVQTAVVWFLVLQVANLPVLVAQKIQIGYQEMHWSNTWQSLGSVLSFLGVALAAWKGLGLVQFIILFCAGPLLAQSLGSYVLFRQLRPWLAPRIAAIRWDCLRDLMGTGGMFVLLQLLAVLGNSSDQILLTRYLGLAAVAEYSLAQRLFSGASVIQFFLTPLWPAFGEALARGDHGWARTALKQTMRLALILSVASAAVIAVAEPTLSRRWVPEIRTASAALLTAFVAQSFMTAYGGTMAVFLNNRKTLRPHLTLYGVASVGAFLAKVWLVKNVGISGVLWGTFGGYALLYVVPAWKLAQKTLGESESSPLSV